jgi:hypothetical protein
MARARSLAEPEIISDERLRGILIKRRWPDGLRVLAVESAAR